MVSRLYLTHWDRATHICVSILTIIGSDNGLSPGRHQAIIWTNGGKLLIGPLGTNFSQIVIWIFHFHSRKCVWKCLLENGDNLVSASMSWNRIWVDWLYRYPWSNFPFTHCTSRVWLRFIMYNFQMRCGNYEHFRCYSLPVNSTEPYWW